MGSHTGDMMIVEPRRLKSVASGWATVSLVWGLLACSYVLAARTFYADGFQDSVITPKKLELLWWQLGFFLLWGVLVPLICWVRSIRLWRNDASRTRGVRDLLRIAALLGASGVSMYFVAVFQAEARDALNHDWIMLCVSTYILFILPLLVIGLCITWVMRRRAGAA
jgi:hypothetical protein